MRLRRLKNFEERAANQEEKFFKDPIDKKGKWHEYFKNSNPIYLEIGMGKGSFINTLATLNPNINYIGMEKSDSITILASERLEEKLSNLIYVNADAIKVREYFEDDEIDRIYLNFSDPWPKARHEKRRLTSPLFLQEFVHILKETGEIEFKTDNLPLFQYSEEIFTSNGFQVKEVSNDLHKDKNNVVMTEYERKFSSMGQKINYIRVLNNKKLS